MTELQFFKEVIVKKIEYLELLKNEIMEMKYSYEKLLSKEINKKYKLKKR